MAMVSQNMTPVYDGAGKLIGYIRSSSGIAYVIIENGFIVFYDSNRNIVGRQPLTQEMLQNIGFVVIDQYNMGGEYGGDYRGSTDTSGGTTTDTGRRTTTTDNGGDTNTTTTVTDNGNGTVTITTDNGDGSTTTVVEPVVPPTMPPTTENPILVTNTPIIIDEGRIISGDTVLTSYLKGGTTTTTTTGNPPPWDPSKPCPPVLRLDYKIDSDRTIDLSEMVNPIQSFITTNSKSAPYDTVDSDGRKIRRYYVNPCDFLRSINIPSDNIITIYNTTGTKGNTSLRFELSPNSSTTKNIGIRDGLIDGTSTPTYFDRLCDLLTKNTFTTRDFYVVFDYEYTDRSGLVHKVYFTARVWIDENGRCVCVEQSLQNCDCKKYTLSLRNLRVVSEPGQGFTYPTTHDPSWPWYNKNLPADKQKICFLKADVFRCCVDSSGNSLGSERVGDLLLAKSYQSTEWVDCVINGVAGKKIKVTQYFLIEDFAEGGFIQFAFDPTFKSKPSGVSFKFPTADLRGDEYYINQRVDLYWSDCDSSGRKSLWGDYIQEKLGRVTDGKIQQFTQYFADVTSGTNRKFNANPSWRPNGPIVQNGVLTSNPSELAMVLTCGAAEGDCIPEPVTPPPPKKEPTEYCVVVDLNVAREIDSGTHVISYGPRKGQILPAYTGGYGSGGVFKTIQYGGYVYDPTGASGQSGYNVLTQYIESTKTLRPGPTTTTRGQRVNLKDEGLPCETGIYETTTSSLTEEYRKVKICYTINEEPGKEGRLDGINIQGGNHGTFDGATTFTNGAPILDPNSREYDPNGGCCESLTWPDNWVANSGVVVPGQPTNQLGGIKLSITRTPQISSYPSVGGMPPANTPYLDHDLSTQEYVMVDSCGCEMIPIADIWCYYNGVKKFLWKRKDIKDERTHVGAPIIVPDERCLGDGAKVYHPFNIRKDISISVRKDKTRGLFDGAQSLDCFYTSSVTSSTSKEYYYDVNDCLNCTKSPYFAVTYGHSKGSGSIYIDSDSNNSKRYTDSIYSQYQLLCNEPTRSMDGILTLPKFTFVSESVEVESDDIYVMNFYRAGLSDKLDPGNFEINLSHLSGSLFANSFHTGSNVKVGSSSIMQFIDNSDDFSQRYLCDDDVLTSYSIVSGSLQNGKYEDATVNTYGRVYPSLGIIVFHPKRLNEKLGFNTVTGSNIAGDNAFKFFTSVSGAASPTVGRTQTYPMLARNVSYKTTHHYSVRVYKNQSNFSNNPTYVTGSRNRIFDKCFIKEPQTYITSVGLYNENLELIAVAKLTRPLKKDFDSDLLIKIRLNW